MALWIEEPKRQQEIEEYFSSINSMSLRIIEDIQRVRERYGESWNSLSVKDQERKINESMVSADVKKHYPLPESKGPELYPTYVVDTGQKVVELPSDMNPNEVAASWRDEHSGPFSLETRSQMELRLPSADGKDIRKKRKKSSLGSEILNQNGVSTVESIKNDLFNSLSGSRSSKSSNGSAFRNYLSGVGDNASARDSAESRNNASALGMPGFAGVKLDFKTDEGYMNSAHGKIENDLPDINFDAEFLNSPSSSKMGRQVTGVQPPEPELSPTTGLSKAYDESEFMDLYPQPKKSTTKVTPPQDVFTRDREVKRGSQRSRKSPRSSGKSWNKSSAVSVPPTVATKPKKSHMKKLSSGSGQVNPRSSLTLDGAIQNLEIAAEINKQGGSPLVGNEKVFSDESDLLRQIEKQTEFDNWLSESPTTADPLLNQEANENANNKSDLHKSGFDFLDNW